MVMMMARFIADHKLSRTGSSLVLSWFLIATVLVPLPTLAASSEGATEQAAVESKEAVKEAAAEQKETTKDSADASEVSKKINCVGGHAACKESERVISILKKIAHYYTEGNFDEISKYLSKDVTTFDEGRHKLIIGRQAVLEDIKTRWEDAHSKGSPVVSYTIYHPYAKVTGDEAVVTFKAVKTVGGKEPQTLSSRCTDVFIQEDGTWKKLHYISNWKKDKPEPKAEKASAEEKTGT
jgi:hypothetical protein